MNRYGQILAASEEAPLGGILDGLLGGLIDRYVRPLCEMFFPEIVGAGDASSFYAFTVRYRADEDRTLAEHRDASVATLNVNLNLPGEEYTGSDLLFVDLDGSRKPVRFAPGVAVVHRGSHLHQALQIESGVRTNLVIWLHAKHGVVRIVDYEPWDQLQPEDRWGLKDPTRLV